MENDFIEGEFIGNLILLKVNLWRSHCIKKVLVEDRLKQISSKNWFNFSKLLHIHNNIFLLIILLTLN